MIEPMKTPTALSLTEKNGRFAVCRIDPAVKIPDWALEGSFYCVTKTDAELSIVCPEDLVPANLKCEIGWRCLMLEGPFSFSLTGILASVLDPLARAEVSIFAISTFDTDYVFVKNQQFQAAVTALSAAGHSIATI
jgi:hypothetical protein